MPDPAAPAPPVADGPAPYSKCVVAAAPQLLMALQFMLAKWNIALFGLTPRDLTGAMATEAIALWAAVVIGMLWVFLSGGPVLRTIRNWQVVLVFAAAAGAAYAMGAAEAVQFLVLVVVTYFGLLLNWKHPSALLQAGTRWAVALAAMMLAAGLCATPERILEWEGNAHVLDAGALYFFLLAAVELSGFHLQYIARNHALITAKLRGMVGKSAA